MNNYQILALSAACFFSTHCMEKNNETIKNNAVKAYIESRTTKNQYCVVEKKLETILSNPALRRYIFNEETNDSFNNVAFSKSVINDMLYLPKEKTAYDMALLKWVGSQEKKFYDEKIISLEPINND